MTLRPRTIGWILTLVGAALLVGAAAVLFAPSDLGVRVAVAVGVPGGLLGVLGLVVLLAEAEYLRQGPDKGPKAPPRRDQTSDD